MSWYGLHPIIKKSQVKQSKACKICNYWLRSVGAKNNSMYLAGTLICNRCGIDRSRLKHSLLDLNQRLTA
jgi:hypothetical protein